MVEFTGLEDFLYPMKKKGYNKEVNDLKLDVISKNSIMKPFFCSIHHIYFWRNMENEYGYCGLCKGFFKKIHFALDSKQYKEGDVISMAWEEQAGMNFKEWEKEKDEVQGTVKEIKKDFGENESMVYIIETENKETVSVWGTGFLDNLMAEIKVGDKIKIVYEGLGKPKKKGYSPPKLFKVFVDK